MEAEVVVRSERELMVKCIWEKCQKAWAEDELERASRLNSMHALFECMTDEEFQDLLSCGNVNCPCAA